MSAFSTTSQICKWDDMGWMEEVERDHHPITKLNLAIPPLLTLTLPFTDPASRTPTLLVGLRDAGTYLALCEFVLLVQHKHSLVHGH